MPAWIEIRARRLWLWAITFRDLRRSRRETPGEEVDR